MPILWSNIMFSPPTKSAKSAKSAAKFDEQVLWIERSRGAALQIKISCNKKDLIAQIMDLLRPHIGRWKSLVFLGFIRATNVRTVFDELRDVRAPMLEVIRFACYDGLGGWEFKAFGGGAPKLLELGISCGLCQIPPSAQLTELSIYQHTTTTSAEGVLATLSAVAPSLEAFHFEAFHILGHSPFDSRSARLLQTFVLPKLRTLDIEHTLLHALVSTRPFPFPALRKLTIDCTFVQPHPPPFPILTQLPNLEVLDLDAIRAFDSRILTICCPLLRELTVNSGERPLSTSQLGLKDMIEARRQRCALGGVNDSLTRIRVQGYSMLPEDLKWLKHNVADFRSTKR